MIPRSGAEFQYLLEAYGSLPAFLFSWTFVLFQRPASQIMVLLVFGSYIIEAIFPGCGGREDLGPLVKILAAAAMGVITFINCASVKWATRVQIIFTAAKMIAIVMLIFTGLVRLAQGKTFYFSAFVCLVELCSVYFCCHWFYICRALPLSTGLTNQHRACLVFNQSHARPKHCIFLFGQLRDFPVVSFGYLVSCAYY